MPARMLGGTFMIVFVVACQSEKGRPPECGALPNESVAQLELAGEGKLLITAAPAGTVESDATYSLFEAKVVWARDGCARAASKIGRFTVMQGDKANQGVKVARVPDLPMATVELTLDPAFGRTEAYLVVIAWRRPGELFVERVMIRRDAMQGPVFLSKIETGSGGGGPFVRILREGSGPFVPRVDILLTHGGFERRETERPPTTAAPGTASDNPFQVCGPKGEQAFLVAEFRCPGGAKPGGLATSKRTAAGVGPDGHMVDRYEVDCPAGRQSVFFDMYHCGD
ncbi:hypothetical protein ACFL6C_00630 [Myxococcota bacterium]